MVRFPAGGLILSLSSVAGVVYNIHDAPRNKTTLLIAAIPSARWTYVLEYSLHIGIRSNRCNLSEKRLAR